MWEARTQTFCTACDNELPNNDKNAICPTCAAFVRIAELEAALDAVLPYARLYSGPQDAEDFESDTRRQARAIKRAERALKGTPVKWDERKQRWVKRGER